MSPPVLAAPRPRPRETGAAGEPQPEKRRSKITFRDMGFSYRGRRALSGVTLDIPERRVTAIIGPSGCGKSTLIKSINRIAEIGTEVKVDGEVRLDERDLYEPGVDLVDLRRRVGMLFQKPNPFPKTIYENVAFGPRIHGTGGGSELEAIVEIGRAHV